MDLIIASDNIKRINSKKEDKIVTKEIVTKQVDKVV